MPTLLRVEGNWPGPIILTLGWFKASARPWNDEHAVPMMRLMRGGAEFLRTAASRLSDITGSGVLSPALYPSATRVWRTAGFEPHVSLQVLEKSLRSEEPVADSFQFDLRETGWREIEAIDEDAFEGFWRMSRAGLEEALEVNGKSTKLVVFEDGEPVGYTIVGTQWRVGYLHRVGVRTDRQGHGYGRALLSESANWARRQGAQSLVLNVRADNARALSVYGAAGFTPANANLTVLGKGDLGVLN